jgi:hypothetical protein
VIFLYTRQIDVARFCCGLLLHILKTGIFFRDFKEKRSEYKMRQMPHTEIDFFFFFFLVGGGGDFSLYKDFIF